MVRLSLRLKAPASAPGREFSGMYPKQRGQTGRPAESKSGRGAGRNRSAAAMTLVDLLGRQGIPHLNFTRVRRPS